MQFKVCTIPKFNHVSYMYGVRKLDIDVNKFVLNCLHLRHASFTRWKYCISAEMTKSFQAYSNSKVFNDINEKLFPI